MEWGSHELGIGTVEVLSNMLFELRETKGMKRSKGLKLKGMKSAKLRRKRLEDRKRVLNCDTDTAHSTKIKQGVTHFYTLSRVATFFALEKNTSWRLGPMSHLLSYCN